MRVLLILILLLASLNVDAISYRYLYGTVDKAKDAELLWDNWAEINIDDTNGIIILSFDDKNIFFNIVELVKYTEKEIVFNVITNNKESSVFTIRKECAMFYSGGVKFILVDIPKKYW